MRDSMRETGNRICKQRG